jgi:hypothetical protein
MPQAIKRASPPDVTAFSPAERGLVDWTRLTRVLFQVFFGERLQSAARDQGIIHAAGLYRESAALRG